MKPDSEYHGGDNIFVPAGHKIDEPVRLHEFSHQYLMKSTHWGVMTYLQVQLRRADRLYSRVEYHFAMGNLFMNAAELTFESHATMNQLLFVKETKQNDVLERLINSSYYKVYCTALFDAFLSLSLPQSDAVYLSGRISQLALATDLYSIPAPYWKSADTLFDAIMNEPELYHPDTRFARLVDTYIHLLSTTSPYDITDKLIIEKSGLNAKTIEYETREKALTAFTSIIKNTFSDSCIDDAIQLIYQSIEMGDMDDLIEQADSLDIPLPLDGIETHYINRLEPYLRDCNVLIVMPYHEMVIMQYHLTEFNKRHVLHCEWEAFEVLFNNFNKAVVLYEEDYDYIQKKFSSINQRRVFYYFEGTYGSFCKCLAKRNIIQPSAYLHMVNEATYCFFINGNDNDIFFTAQNQGGVSQIARDISASHYNYINTDTNNLDGIFFCDKEDYWHFEDVIKGVLHVKLVGGRCYLD